MLEASRGAKMAPVPAAGFAEAVGQIGPGTEAFPGADQGAVEAQTLVEMGYEAALLGQASTRQPGGGEDGQEQHRSRYEDDQVIPQFPSPWHAFHQEAGKGGQQCEDGLRRQDAVEPPG
jgi:hypothetical protein